MSLKSNLYFRNWFCFACFRAQNGCVRTQSVDLHQKKYGFYAKIGRNPLSVQKIAVPLHRQKETSRHLQ
jgi:hypothetical protein